jgi:hypothetical protein
MNNDKKHRMEMDGDFMIIAPNPEGSGYIHSLSERVWLVENIINFQKNNPKIPVHNIAIYELKEVNLRHGTSKVE